MSRVIFVALLVIIAGSATAQTIDASVHRSGSGWTASVVVGRGGHSTSPAIVARRTVTPAMRAAWTARCQPRDSEPDRYGIIRVIYAAPGCQYGP